jgi:hypothetical protein
MTMALLSYDLFPCSGNQKLISEPSQENLAGPFSSPPFPLPHKSFRAHYDYSPPGGQGCGHLGAANGSGRISEQCCY